MKLNNECLGSMFIEGLDNLRAAKAVRLGVIWANPMDVPKLLERYCKHIFTLNDWEQYPHSFPGSGTTLRMGNRHFLFCCGHQLEHFDPNQIGFRPEIQPTHIITGSTFSRPSITDENRDTDFIDVRSYEFQVQNYPIPNLTSEFFNLDDRCIWPNGQTGTFMVFGFPTNIQDFGYEKPGIRAQMAGLTADYDGASSSPYLHRLKMRKPLAFDADGMSGGPVFYLGRDEHGFFIGFAGMTLRGGSAGSEIIHFIEAAVLAHFAHDGH